MYPICTVVMGETWPAIVAAAGAGAVTTAPCLISRWAVEDAIVGVGEGVD